MLFKFALRNIMRNKKRSFFTTLTIFFAAIVVGFAQSWTNGLINVYIENFTRYQTGHIRICTAEFSKREKFMPVDELITGSEKLIEKLRGLEQVRAVRERIRFGILVGKDETTTEAMGMGIDLNDNEFDLSNKIKTGTFTGSGMYIGYRLAEKLGIVPGDELLLATRTSEGGLNGIKLPVEGVFSLGMQFDKKSFFIGLADAKRLLKMHDASTELFIYAHDADMTDSLKTDIVKLLPVNLTADTYKEQLGTLYETLDSTKVIYSLVEGVILFLASFVIINTMMMAIFERIREIGTMKALGMTDQELFINFTLEGALLGAAGGILGAAVGFCIIAVLSHTGIDMTTQLQGLDMPFEYIIRPRIGILDLVISLSISIVIPALAAMIPARHARKLMPAEALRS